MSFSSRIANVFRSDRLIRELDEEFESHIDEAIEHGHDPAAARRAFGSPLRHREASRDLLMAPWLDSLRSDAIFGWRQLMKRKITSAVAILSLGLAIGACTSAFRLIDALLLQPLPIANPERLYKLAYRGRGEQTAFDSLDYADFGQLRAAMKGEAELIGVSSVDRMDLTWQPGAGLAAGLEKANVQYVSGWMFASFGLRPALGRLITGSDDLEPGAHPIALLSWDYWTRRFGRDPNVIGQSVEIGRKYGIGNDLFQIVGVVNEGFTGTEPGRMTDLFAPATMSAFVNRSEASWLKTYIRLPPGVAPAAVEERLRAAASRILEHSTTPWRKAPEAIGMEPAGGGVSSVQRDYRQALTVLGVLVALVLLIACANVANLMTAQGTARAREMALRVAIGAGRRRLVQLVLVESAMLALLAGAAGGLFTWWSTPFVVGRINPPDNPVRLSLDANWRVLAFGLAVTVAATVLFGLAPALRASAIKPALALKGGEDPHSRRRSMHVLIAVQVAFSFLVLFIAGLFAGTFERLSHQPVGFSTERLLNIDTTAERAQPPVFWDYVAERLRAVPGVETVTLADWPPLDGYSYKFNAISVDGGAPSAVQAAFMNVSPGWIDAMKIPFVAGRDFRPNELSPSVAIVNEAFAWQYFNGENPIGRSFTGTSYLQGQRFQIVGLVRDARYRYVRQDVLPVAYTPFHRLDAKGAAQDLVDGTFSVRTASPNPLALASTLRKEVTAIRPGFRVSNIRTEQEIIESQTVRERLLAILALFFAAVALLLAAIGLYGVLDYSVFQQRREIGIRMAIGAQTGDIARRVTFDIAGWICAGSLVGLALGIGCARFIESLLYQVNATDLGAIAAPALALIAAAILAALPPVIRAIHIDPARVLRSE